MQFLSDVYLRCQDCNGQRYRPEILEIRIERNRGGIIGVRSQLNQLGSDPNYSVFLNVADVLELTVGEALEIFTNDRDVVRALQPIVDVGLDYVKLGQPVPTLSGGEAQRLKLAGFLADAAKAKTSSKQSLAKKVCCSCLMNPQQVCTSMTLPNSCVQCDAYWKTETH